MPAPLTIRLHPNDNVVVARMDILPSTKVEGDVAALTRVPPGHKILTRAVKQGRAAAQVQPDHRLCDRRPRARHAHPHAQLRHGRFRARLCLLRRRACRPTTSTPPATFMGYRRADGRGATRNYIGIVTTVNCSAATSRMIAKHVEPLLGASSRTSTASCR